MPFVGPTRKGIYMIWKTAKGILWFLVMGSIGLISVFGVICKCLIKTWFVFKPFIPMVLTTITNCRWAHIHNLG